MFDAKKFTMPSRPEAPQLVGGIGQGVGYKY